jgi:hypothetical protein
MARLDDVEIFPDIEFFWLKFFDEIFARNFAMSSNIAISPRKASGVPENDTALVEACATPFAMSSTAQLDDAANC